MRVRSQGWSWLVGKGWRLGPFTEETKWRVIAGVIVILEWGIATRLKATGETK